MACVSIYNIIIINDLELLIISFFHGALAFYHEKLDTNSAATFFAKHADAHIYPCYFKNRNLARKKGARILDLNPQLSAGITLGETYPKPMINLMESRQAALSAYQTLKEITQ